MIAGTGRTWCIKLHQQPQLQCRVTANLQLHTVRRRQSSPGSFLLLSMQPHKTSTRGMSEQVLTNCAPAGILRWSLPQKATILPTTSAATARRRNVLNSTAYAFQQVGGCSNLERHFDSLHALCLQFRAGRHAGPAFYSICSCLSQAADTHYVT